MDASTCSKAKTVALSLLKDEVLHGLIFVEGGLVPWIISGNDSGRKHGDVDFSVHLEDIGKIRNWLKANDLYDIGLDSRELRCNPEKIEYGIHAVIDDVLVSFAPFVINGEQFEQRNAVHTSFEGYDALFVAKTQGIKESDFVEMRTLPDGSSLGMSTLEAVRAAKASTDREKDLTDIAEIDRIGYNKERYARLAATFKNMTVNCPAHSG